MSRKIQKILWNKQAEKDHGSWEKLRNSMEGIGNLEVTRIGASDTASLLGKSPYKCPARLFFHLVGRHNSFTMTESTVSGHLLEPLVAERFMGYDPDDMEQTLRNWQAGVRIRKIKKAKFFVVNRDYPFLFSSLDYVPVGKVYSPFTGELYPPLTPIEMKTTVKGYRMNWGERGIPYVYETQLNTQMLTTDTKLAVFNVLVDGYNYEVREYERDDIMCEDIVTSSESFAQLVALGKQVMEEYHKADTLAEKERCLQYLDHIAPDPIGITDDVNLANELSGNESNGLSMLGTEEHEQLMHTYLIANETIKIAEEDKNTVRAKLVRELGEFEKIETETAVMTYRRTEGKRSYFNISEVKKKEIE